MVLGRLVNDAALDDEAARLGISTGDDTVRDQVTATPAFHGSDGRSTARPTPTRSSRPACARPSSRTCSAASPPASCSRPACRPPATLPETEALTVLGFLGEKRSFDWIRLDAGLLPEPIPAPTDADLAAEHDAHAAERYTRPETRQIAYASVTAESLAAEIEIPEDELRAAYDAAIETYRPPSAGRSTASASAPPRRPRPPRRGSTPARSTSTRSPPSAASSPRRSTRASSPPTRLAPEARDAVFGAAGPGIVGPVATPLGPSLYRINAVLAANDHALRGGPRPSSRRTGRSRRRSGRSSRTPRISRT